MYKLLLVDDEAEIRNGLSLYFPWHEIGFEITAALDNGRKALEFIHRNHVDVMLCDIMMPIMTGLELAKELHDCRSRLKIILLSGYKDFEYAKQALSYNVKGYIVKPTKYNELYEVFSSLKMELDQEGPRPVAATFDEKVTAEIKSYVEQHYREVTLEDAAALVHMNPFYVSKYFKEKTGQTFTDYVVQVKMKKAAELLNDIRYKTYEISEMVGYSHAKNFTRTFKKYFGVSPRAYRNERYAGKE